MVQPHPDSRLFQEAPFRFLAVARVHEGDGGELLDSTRAVAFLIINSLVDRTDPTLAEAALDGVASLKQLRWAEYFLKREVAPPLQR
jgi:hypothetical protein